MQTTMGPHSEAICALILGLCDFYEHPYTVGVLSKVAYAEFIQWQPRFSKTYEAHKTSGGIRKMFGPTDQLPGIGKHAAAILYTLYRVKHNSWERIDWISDAVSEAAIRASEHKCLGFVTWSANTHEASQEDIALSQGALMVYSVYEKVKEIVRVFEQKFREADGKGEEATNQNFEFVKFHRDFAETLWKKCQGRIYKIQNGTRSSAIFGP
jgi:hypothetical protein